MMDTKHILAQYAPKRENVLLILHHLQGRNPRHYLTPEDLTLTADYLKTSRGVIYGIASYYSMFSLTPRGRHIIRMCNSPVCHIFGAFNLIDEVTRLLKIDVGQTTANGGITLELTECIGCCDAAPAMMINETLVGNLSAPKIRSLLTDLRQSDIQ